MSDTAYEDGDMQAIYEEDAGLILSNITTTERHEVYRISRLKRPFTISVIPSPPMLFANNLVSLLSR